MAERLTGEDEKAIRQDAEMMVKLMGTNKVAPLGNPEPNNPGTISTRDSFAEWFNSQ